MIWTQTKIIKLILLVWVVHSQIGSSNSSVHSQMQPASIQSEPILWYFPALSSQAQQRKMNIEISLFLGGSPRKNTCPQQVKNEKNVENVYIVHRIEIHQDIL